MMKEPAIKKMISSMYTEGILSKEDEDRMKIYLDWMYQAGYEQGMRDFTKDIVGRPVEFCDSLGNMIKIFPNTRIAAEDTGYGRSTIAAAIRSERVTKRGHIWRYLADEQDKNTCRGDV